VYKFINRLVTGRWFVSVASWRYEI